MPSDPNVPAAHALVELPSPTPPSPSPASAYLSGLADGAGRRSQRSALRSLALMLGGNTPFDVEWKAVTAADVRGTRARLRTLYEGATVNRMMSALRGTLRLAHGGQLPIDIAIELKGNENTAPPPGRALGSAELVKLIKAARPTKAGIRDAAIIAVMYGSGLRLDSTAKLDASDYDREAHAFLARKAKGGKTYSAQMYVPLEPFLTKWLDVRGAVDGALFCHVSRWDQVHLKRLSTQAIRDAIETLRVRAGVDPFTPHDLRRTFGTELLDSGADPIAVARLMGHEDVSTTMRYDRRGVDKLAKLVEGGLPALDFKD